MTMTPLHHIITTDEMHTFDRDKYPEGFFHWLQLNAHIWWQFERYAMSMAGKRKRYSARTIIEVMRWNTDIKQSDVTFKLSNNMTPGLARLWMDRHGKKYPKFFTLHNQ